MRAYLPEILLLLAGLLVMALLLYLGAASQGWVALLCFLAAAVVYHGWQRQLLILGQKILGKELDSEGGNFPG